MIEQQATPKRFVVGISHDDFRVIDTAISETICDCHRKDHAEAIAIAMNLYCGDVRL